MDTLQQDTEPLPYIPDQANDTGRHHMYRAHQDCAAAVSVRRRIRSAMLGIPLDPGQHRLCPVCLARLGGTRLCPSCEQDGAR